MSVKEVKTYIYKKPHRSGRVTWIIKWLDPETRTWHYKPAGKSKAEALLVQGRVREDLFRGVEPYPERNQNREITVGELIDQFYDHPRFLNASERWKIVVKGQFENRIRPALGRHKFMHLKRNHLLDLYKALKEEGLAHATICKYHLKISLLSQLYDESFPDTVNPFNQVKDFTKLFPRQAPTRDINFLTPEELESIYKELEKFNNPLFLPFIKFLACTGMRRSEALELKWTDIDYKEGFIQVRKSKTGKTRRVPLEKGSIEALAMLRHPYPHVFTTPKGVRYHKDSYIKPLQLAAKRANIQKRIDIHTLRHSWGSNKIRIGWGMKAISKILGHSNVSITDSTYTHLLDGDLCVRDEFRFDKKPEIENINSVEGKFLNQFIQNIISAFPQSSSLMAHSHESASYQVSVKPSNVSQGNEQHQKLESTHFSPHALRKKEKSPLTTQSDDYSFSNLSNNNADLRWRARYESNVRPSASEADALSN